jgi:hypothetical protein
MSTPSLVLVERRFRRRIPEAHRTSLDTRIQWLWNQRFGTVQMVWKDSPDVLDQTAATLILQAIIAKDLESIHQLFQRLEGPPVLDDQIGPSTIRV